MVSRRIELSIRIFIWWISILKVSSPYFVEFIYEIGAENRVLGNGRFSASGNTGWVTGRYEAHDGRLNNDRPWGLAKTATNPWFKVDLRRVMLVDGISIQGDGTYGSNYYPDYKIQYSFDATPTAGALITIKEETTSSEKVLIIMKRVFRRIDSVE